ncbi:MAG TPA: STAS/SEC14 domain-containing protein [Methylococcaceae bacterium]|jgi:hypothetical protein|nr:STAS/SEC14 domain-containing protein [Methylococcaceae bacterium]HIA46197.1 STAS/SEC14 domain-containing protein [Methylococcaceae bacterium]HIN67802.1 STAS/SEC14 domain-containing protein [Methylococcales bacterium]HIO44754.1 STAS/SEC14 domain-containing protein [Methylococcales bacterium]
MGEGMEHIKQGFLMEIKQNDDYLFIALKAMGKLTYHDYQTLVLEIELALDSLAVRKIKALVDVTQLTGWTLRALWEDCKFGLRHRKTFIKVAIYGAKGRYKYAALVGQLFISGEMKYFEQQDEAFGWVSETR